MADPISWDYGGHVCGVKVIMFESLERVEHFNQRYCGHFVFAGHKNSAYRNAGHYSDAFDAGGGGDFESFFQRFLTDGVDGGRYLCLGPGFFCKRWRVTRDWFLLFGDQCISKKSKSGESCVSLPEGSMV